MALWRLHGLRRCVSVFASLRASAIEVRDEQDFQQRVVQADHPMLVDFHASWCGPCERLSPLLDAAVTECDDGVLSLAKVDIDQLPELAMKHQVTSVPTVLGMSGGKIRGRFVGLQDADYIKNFINNLLQQQE